MKSKHMICGLVGFVLIVAVLLWMSSSPPSDTASCGCVYEGLYKPKTPALRAMEEKNKQQTQQVQQQNVRQNFISYANKPLPERFVPPPRDNSMFNQMRSMQGTPVQKSMNNNSGLRSFIG